MYFDREIFVRVLRILFRPRTFSWRRLVGGGGFLVVLFVMGAIRDAFQALDYVLYPKLRETRVRAPVFVIANPRSGTTFLHRLLSLDSEQFTYMRTWETLFPSVTLYAFVDGVSALDRAVGRPGGRLIKWFERRLFKGWDGVHHVGFSAPEEDEFVFISTLLDPAAWIMLPFPQEFRDIIVLDDLSARRRDKVMRLYERSLRAHAFARGRGAQVVLSKNVFHGGRLRALIDTFPDARFVHLVRDPRSSLASSMSMFTAPWSFHSPDVPLDGGQARFFADVGLAYYDRVHRLEPELREAGVPFTTYTYEQFVTDPRGTVEDIYDRLGLEMTDEFRERLVAQTSQARSYKSTHDYNLAQFGVTEAEILAAIPEVFEAYGFDASDAGRQGGSDEEVAG